MINIIALKETFCSSSHSQGEIAGKIGKNNHNKALIECELAIWKMLPRMLPARKKVLPGDTTISVLRNLTPKKRVMNGLPSAKLSSKKCRVFCVATIHFV
jgi:hypothetical protein